MRHRLGAGLRSVAILAGLVNPGIAFSQGMPVIDAANLLQSIEAVMQMKQQLQSQLALFQSMNGVRGMGSIGADASLANYVPGDWRNVYAAIRTRGYSGLTPPARVIRQSTQVFDCSLKSGQARSLCEFETGKSAQDEAFLSEAYSQAQRRYDELELLRNQIDSAQDPKAIADLSARLAEENSVVANEQAKLALFKAHSDAQDRFISQQKHELAMRRLEATESTMRVLAASVRQAP